MSRVTMDAVMGKIHKLPSLSTVVMGLLASLSQEDLDIDLLSKKITTDQVLTAKTLKVVIDMQGTPFGADKTASPKFRQTLWLAEGDKVRWQFEQPKADKTGKVDKDGLALCDGKALIFHSGATKLKRDTEAGFGGKLKQVASGYHGRQLVGQLLGFDPQLALERPVATSGYARKFRVQASVLVLLYLGHLVISLFKLSMTQLVKR